MNYYRRYVGDYLSKTIRLSPTEHGCYNLLLDFYYAEERPVPLDMAEVRVICRATTAQDLVALDKVLARYFVREEDGFHNARADKEIGAARQARLNGKRHVSGTGSPTGSPTRKATRKATRKTSAQGHPPTSNLQPPTSEPLALEPPTAEEGQRRTAAAPRRGPEDRNGQGKTREAEGAYREAMRSRYGTDPGNLNGKQRALLSKFIERVPVDEAPAIIRHYVGSNRGLYVSATHCVELLLRDAEALRIAWKTGASVTDTAARQADETQARGEVFRKLIDEADGHGK